MKKERINRTSRITISLLIICFVFYMYLPPTTNIVDSMNETVGENHVDILCVGSSHMYCGINPVQMYNDYGYAAYTLGVGAQSPWQSYYYIKEACKYQKPSVIIQDAYMMGCTQTDNDYCDYQTAANLVDAPLSYNKTCAVIESVADSKLNILLRFPYVYNEYASFFEFTPQKFFGDENYSMGYEYRSEVMPCTDVVDKSGITDETPISKKNEEYLRKIIDYCRNNDIDLILLNAPCPVLGKDNQVYYNYIKRIAKENKILFINGDDIWKEVGMDWNTDSSDGGHLNHSGVTKFTKYVEEYIHSKYDIPDRRGENGYEAYDRGVEWLKEKLSEGE